MSHCVKNEGTHQIVMSYSSPIVGCLLKEGLQKGGRGTRISGPPSYAPVGLYNSSQHTPLAMPNRSTCS